MPDNNKLNLSITLNPESILNEKNSNFNLKTGEKGYFGNTNFGESNYDKPQETSWQEINPQELERLRGERQGWAAEAANMIGGGIAKIPFSVIGNTASMLDFEDYANTDKEVGNAVTAWAEEMKGNIEEATKIYKSNDNTLGSREWWLNNGKGLIDSAGGFVISGGMVGKGVQILSNLAKGSRVIQGVGTVTNAAMLNQAESIPIAMGVYQKTLELTGDEQKAADAAAYSININRINIPLNLTSAGAFLRPIALTRQVAKDVSRKEVLGKLLSEGAQEYTEENINNIAENEAVRKAQDGNKYLYDINNTINDVFSQQGFEAGIIGFLGGAIQTGGTETLKSFQKDSPSYDLDGNIVMNEQGVPVLVTPQQSQKEKFRAQQKSINDIELLSKIESVPTIKETLDNVKTTSGILNDIQEAAIQNNESKVQELQNDLLINQSVSAFKNGTTDQLINLYKSIASDPISKDRFGEDYKIKAHEAVTQIEQLEKVYNKYSSLPQVGEVLTNRAKYDFSLKQADAVKQEILKSQMNQQREMEITGFTKPEQILKLSSTKDLQEHLAKMEEIKSKVIALDNDFNNILSDKYTKQFVNSKKEESYAKEQQIEDAYSNPVEETSEGFQSVDNTPVDNVQYDDESPIKFVGDKIINRQEGEEFTPDEQQFYENNKDEIEAYIQSQTKPPVTQPVEQVTQPIDNQSNEVTSNGVTNSFDDDLNSDNVLEPVNNSSNKEFVSKRPNALMMKFYKFGEGVKTWARDKTGEVIEEPNPDVSIEVNTPSVAKTGTELTYKYKGEDISLIDSKNRTVGFIALPHILPKDASEASKLVLEELKSIRSYILSHPSESLKTTVLDKGHGKLLTKVQGNVPINDQTISFRPEDMVDGRPLFLYDNGVGLVGKDLNEEQTSVATNFEYKSFAKPNGTGIGKVFQVVKTANGSWFVIPVYTTLINQAKDSTAIIHKILTSLHSNIISPTEINYTKVIQDINKYVFVTNTKNYSKNVQALRIKEDKEHVEEGKISVAGVSVSFNDIKQGVNLDDFIQALGTVRHNISVNDMNIHDYQKELIDNDVLSSNAYTDSQGQYYVQPYIEVNNPDGYKPAEVETTEEIKPVTNNNETKQDLDKPSFDVDSHEIGDDFAFSRTKLEGTPITSKSVEQLSKILPGITLADAKLIEEVGKNMKDTYGMFHNMLIYLFNGATNQTMFHEAFHGVFRNILSDSERIGLLNEAQVKYENPSKERLDFLRQAPGNANLSDDVLTQLHYEERLADDFAKYADGELNKSLGNKILDFFKKIFNLFNIFKNSNTSQVESLFENVIKGKYTNRSTAASLLNKAIDLNKFGQAYTRVLGKDNIPLAVELDRTYSIANQVLNKIAQEVSKGITIEKVDIGNIAGSIKQQYSNLWKSEDTKPETEKNKDLIKIAYQIDNNFAEIFENVKKHISTTRKIKIKGNFKQGTTLEQEEGTIDDNRENEDMSSIEGNEVKGYQEMTSISGIKSASHAIKLFLSNIPVINKQGIEEKDAYGFPLFYSYERIYHKLETSLIGTTTFAEQIKIMNDLADFSLEIKGVLNAINNVSDFKTAKNFQQQFAANFNKQVLNYKLVTYNKVGNSFVFKTLDPNRQAVALNLKTQWTETNLLDPTNKITDDIRTFNTAEGIYQLDKPKIEALLKAYEDKGKTTDSGKKLIPELSISEVFELAQKLGIGLSYDTIKIKSELAKPEQGYATQLQLLTQDLLNYAEQMFIKDKHSSARTILDKLIKLEMSAQTELFTSSFSNVENSIVYAIQHQSFASKLINSLTTRNQASADLVNDLQRDPMNNNNFVLKNKELLSMFALDGLKQQGDSTTGKKFNQIDSDDYLAMIINMYINQSADQNITTEATALYAPIIPAEKGLSFGFTGKKLSVSLNEDGTINPVNPIVDEFRQLFFNELARIRETMLYLRKFKDSPKDLINNYHLGKKLGLEFNLTNAVDKKLKSNLDSFLETTLDNSNIETRTASESLKRLLENSSLMKEVNEVILKDLNNIVKSHNDLVLSKNIVTEENGNLVSDKIITKQPLKNILAEWSLNSYLFNISSSLLMNGDPAFYKGADDNGKRFYQAYSMLKFADTSVIDDSYKYLTNGKMKINIVADVKQGTKSSNDLTDIAKESNNPNIQQLAEENYNADNAINATDAQMFVSENLYNELQRLFGQEVDKYGAIKPFFYANQWNAQYQRYEPIQVKCSIFPLTNNYVASNSLLAKHKELMDSDINYPQVIAFESTMKALSPFKTNIQDPTNTSIVELDLKNFGEQVANPDHMLDSENSSLRQLKMLFYGMVDDTTDYNGRSGREIKSEIAQLDAANIYESLKEVVSGFEGNKKELTKFISEAITARNSTSIIEKVFELKPDGTFQYPLDLINSKTTIQLISSIFSGEVVRQEFRGGSAVQVTSVGLHIDPKESDYKNPVEFQTAVDASKTLSELQTSLQWVKKDLNNPKSIEYIEVAAPYHVKEFINADGTIKDNIPDEMREMLVYRIPTEGAHSMMAVKVVHFLPKEYKGVMLMPYEVTTQFGADFDFDKIFFIAKDYKMDNGEIKPYKFIEGKENTEERYSIYKEHVKEDLLSLEDFSELSIIEQNIKPARNNKLLNNYNHILRSTSMLESLITPSGPGAIAEVYEVVKKSINKGNFFTPEYQLYNKDLFHKISKLKGVAALQVSGHAWATEGNLTVKPTSKGVEQGIKIWNASGSMETRNQLSHVLSDGKTKIVEELSSMMAVILDAVKTPDQLPSIGISMKTLPIWSYIVRLGLGSKVASQFTSQQAIKDLSLALESNDKQLKDKNFTKKDVDTVIGDYNKLYQEAINSETNNSELQDYIFKHPLDKVSKYDRLSLEQLNKYTGKSLTELKGKDKLEYLQLQIVTLNIFKDSEKIIGELGQLNNLFSINKETGPNFEDINSKLELYKSLSSETTLIEGLGQLLNTDAIKPYIDTVDAQYDVLSKHYNFASPFFNSVKNTLAKIVYGSDSVNLTRIPSEDRETINGFIQMYLDAETTFKDIYTNTNRLSEKEFIDEMKILLSSKVHPDYEFKLFNGRKIPVTIQEKFKILTLAKSLVVNNIKNSEENYISLKGGRYELNQKELIINDITTLYNTAAFKPLIKRLIEHSFINTGMFTGINSYSGYIDPSILQDMGLVKDRKELRPKLHGDTNLVKVDNIINQLVRNFPKKFSKVYDNDNKLFTELDNGKTLVLNKEANDSRKKELLKDDGQVEYIRFKLNSDYTPIYKLDRSNTEQITYRQVTFLGQPGKKIEINPFGEVETKFPNNKYEKLEIGIKSKAKEPVNIVEEPNNEVGDNSENIIVGQQEIKPIAKDDVDLSQIDLESPVETVNLEEVKAFQDWYSQQLEVNPIITKQEALEYYKNCK